MSESSISNNKNYLNQILDEIFQISDPVIDKIRSGEILSFIETTVNGDTIQEYLVINATLTKDRMGILVYILTNMRLIKVEIDGKQGIKSSSFILNSMVGVERKLNDGDRAEITVAFQSGSVGLRYSSKNQKITSFFQNVESQSKECANG